ncbi:MAG: hypothetical protein Q4C56_03880 [Peptococcaceae bacterium]|nr:hypothetical protein [Peptococcaceae bacterium]
MKRLTIALCLLLALSLSACGDKGKPSPEPSRSAAENVDLSAARASSPKEDAPEPAADDGVQADVDLTTLSSTMVYSEVYNMLYANPEDYVGKTIKMTGTLGVYEPIDNEGNTIPDTPTITACIVKDATACCATGIEFTPPAGVDLPKAGASITLVGELEAYQDRGMNFYRIKNTQIL